MPSCRRAERDEALEQQTATAEVLQVINSSPGDLEPVFEALLENAHTLCGAASWDDWHCTTASTSARVAAHGVGANSPDLVTARPPTAAGNSACGSYQKRGRRVQVADAANKPGIEPVRRLKPSICQGAHRAVRAAARGQRADRSNSVSAARRCGRSRRKQIALLENFAAQAVIAMENARLIDRDARSFEQQTATAEVLQVINSSPGDLAPVFEAMLEKAQLCAMRRTEL